MEEKLFDTLEQVIIKQFSKDKEALERMAEYFSILKNSTNEKLLQLIDDCKVHNFQIIYEKDNTDFTDGKIIIRLNNNISYEIELSEIGYIGECTSKVNVHRIENSEDILYKDEYKAQNIFDIWYSRIKFLFKKNRQERINDIDNQIKQLQNEKLQLMNES